MSSGNNHSSFRFFESPILRLLDRLRAAFAAEGRVSDERGAGANRVLDDVAVVEGALKSMVNGALAVLVTLGAAAAASTAITAVSNYVHRAIAVLGR